MSLNTHREARGRSSLCPVAPSAKTRGEGHRWENQKSHRNSRSSLILSPVPRRAPVGTAARTPPCLPKLRATKDISPRGFCHPPARGGTAAPCGEHMLNVKTRQQFILRQFFLFFLTVYFLLEEAGAFPILAASTADRLAEV